MARRAAGAGRGRSSPRASRSQLRRRSPRRRASSLPVRCPLRSSGPSASRGPRWRPCRAPSAGSAACPEPVGRIPGRRDPVGPPVPGMNDLRPNGIELRVTGFAHGSGEPCPAYRLPSCGHDMPRRPALAAAGGVSCDPSLFGSHREGAPNQFSVAYRKCDRIGVYPTLTIRPA